ncbi:RNA:NAD 2'-phosphotransferase [Thermoplasmatales archaeon BRNA1]|nr:RNA:NAD 2'-phosphotransferase [Thermoplasmatales archaeon BRNA1]
MINECEQHGYYRDDYCPVCGEKGKFVMSDFEVEKLGRTLAAVLRHGKYDLEMDPQGFVDMRDIISIVKENNPRMKWLRSRHIEALALTDPKGRYQIRGHNIRATYGHTIKLDLQLPTDRVPAYLYYPVSEEEGDIIMETGIRPTDRAMVHLSATYRDAVNAGRAHLDDPLILEVDTEACAEAGHPIGRAAKTVYLCDMVPADCVYEAEPPDSGEDD